MMGIAYTMIGNMQNCMVAYTQSDEISFLLKDWTNIETSQWFDGNLQKLASVSASMATAYFNHAWPGFFPDIITTPALFDARAFNLPREEVVNYFIWRQQDATRNSIQFIGRKHFSHKELHGKSNEQIQEMLWSEHDCNWNDYAVWKRRGACVYRQGGEDSRGASVMTDNEIPVFTQDRSYIGRFIE